MITVLCYILFVILAAAGFWLLFSKERTLRVPYSPGVTMKCSGAELLYIFILSTGIIGLTPVLSVHLAVLEVLCVAGIFMAKRRLIWSWPLMLYVMFLAWAVIGIFYSPSMEFGARMTCKYLYPLLLALFASVAVKNFGVVLKGLLIARLLALISIVVLSIPAIIQVVQCFLWHRASVATNYITMCMVSLALFFMTSRKKSNLIIAGIFAMMPFVWVFRTDIMGLMVALSVFMLVRYGFKALPIIVLIGIISVCSIFYIPAVKNKMFFSPDEVTLTDFLTNNVNTDNINTSGRKTMWKDVQKNFVDGHELAGSGTGRVQTYMYTEVNDWRRTGQIHNDFLVLEADNGYIGLGLFILSYLGIAIHCAILYRKSDSPRVKLCALVAASSLMGVMATMYSDNTISYSMVTLSYPWAVYGAALALEK